MTEQTTPTLLPEPYTFPHHVLVGEPDTEEVLWFQDNLIPWFKETDLSKNIAIELGHEAAKWLRSDASGGWRFVSRSERKEHPDRLIKTRIMEFEQEKDIKEFQTRLKDVLARVSILDLGNRLSIQNVTECSLIHEGYYDPSPLDLGEAVKRFKAFRRDLIGLIDTFERIDFLSRSIGLLDPASQNWMRVIYDGEMISLEPNNKADPNDPASFPVLLEKLTNDVAAGAFDLSKLEANEVIPTLRKFCWRVRQVRKAWRAHNEDRIKRELKPVPVPF